MEWIDSFNIINCCALLHGVVCMNRIVCMPVLYNKARITVQRKLFLQMNENVLLKAQNVTNTTNKYICSLSKIKTKEEVQAALLFGDLQRAFRTPQPPGPEQKPCTPPVSQFSCCPDWSLREGRAARWERTSLSSLYRGRWSRGEGLTRTSCLRTKRLALRFVCWRLSEIWPSNYSIISPPSDSLWLFCWG